MHRSEWPRWRTAGLLVLFAWLCLMRPCMAAEQPNILFIFADDWGWGDLGCHGHPSVKTPNIDRLAREGTDFHRFTVASGVCSPSRTAVLTGQFPARFNIDGHFAWVEQNAARNMPDWLDPETTTLPRLLKQAGYATAHFGKWHLANDMIPDAPRPEVYGYDDVGAFNCSGEQMPVHEDADRTIAFIEQAVAEGRPFFVNLWIHEPHTPFHVLPKYRQQFPDLEEADNIYAATLAHADARIGEVLDALDRLGLADETLVVFSSDNGPARAGADTPLELMYDTATGAGFGIAASKGITGGRKGYKASLFEGGIGVPFIVRWPGQTPAGRVDRETLLSAVDLLPTFCEVAGAAVPEGYQSDGISQLAALRGTPSSRRASPLFWRTDARWPAPKVRPNHWAGFVVVHDRWKLLTSRSKEHVELYDLVADPLEADDLASDTPEVVADLLARLRAWEATLLPKPAGEVFSSLRHESK
jgi:arylsulfatase A-like enzyme